MITLSGCSKVKGPLEGEYKFLTQYNKPSASKPEILEKGQIFDGSIRLAKGSFFISGTDTQQWPWQTKPQNRHEEEKGTYTIKEDIITFSSPDIKEGGWSFSGEFKFFIFKTKEEAMKKVEKKNTLYHLLQREGEYILLINPYFVEKENI